LSEKIAKNKIAMDKWDKALASPTIGNIFSFYHCAGIIEPVISWREIDEREKKIGSHTER
jgi:hypothetical protein